MSTNVNAAPELPIEQAMDLIESCAQDNSSLTRRGRLLNAVVMLEIGEHLWRMSINAGRVTDLRPGPFVMPGSTLRIGAPQAEWQLFWQPVPPPGSHDLFALLKRGVLKLDGDLHPFMSHLFYFKQLLAAPRQRGRLA